MDLVIDILLLGIVGIVTWLLANEGPWTAILAFFSVVFAGLIAMNFFEPLAEMIGKPKGSWLETRADFLALMGLFALFTFLLRLGLDNVAPTNIELPDIAYQAGRWLFAFGTGYVAMAVVLTAMHTAPLPRNFLGFKPERKNFLGVMSPDLQWLGFTQHVTEHIFGRRIRVQNQNNQMELSYRNFDGLRVLFPGRPSSDYLPTFIIRYASRRDEIGGIAPRPVPVQAAPSSGGPAAGPAF
ncbi:MAG: hypothetical protein JWM11_318 [Planctomycetaceae bacterium]|nr:hypothetical protein [Planctomycetaceae bacterium]